MTTRAISLPLSCFIYRLSVPKPIEKWSTFIKINEESFSNLKKRSVIDGYGGFQDKARECGIEKLNFSFGVKHKKPEPPDFPNGRLFTVSSEDEWQIYQEFLFGEDGKEYELVVKASQVILTSVVSHLGCQPANSSEVSSQQETAEACEVSSRRATKRRRPKSERKKLDGELFKRLKADSSAEVD